MTKSPPANQGLPGKIPTLAFTWSYLGIFLLLPLGILAWRMAGISFSEAVTILKSERVAFAFMITLRSAGIAAILNAFFGTIVAWVLVRYPIPFKHGINSLIDLPFALPTSVTGILLVAILGSTGPIGVLMLKGGISLAYTQAGIVIAMMVVTSPFVIRTVQPVLENLDPDMEFAAESLGANRAQTFMRIILPAIFPSILGGTVLAFARALGEYGSLIFISGNMPFKTEVLSLLIMSKMEQYDYAGAMVLSVTMMAISFGLLLGMHTLHRWTLQRSGMGDQG